MTGAVKVRAGAIGCLAVAAAVVAASASATTPPRPVPPIPVNPQPGPGGRSLPLAKTTATLSTTRAGARPVAVTLKVHYEMVCGQPGPGTAIITFPRAAFVPPRIDRSAVLVNGKPTPSVTVAGHAIAVAMPPRGPGVSCLVIGPGTLTLTLKPAVGLGNPRAAGTYVIGVRRETRSFRAFVKISA